MSQVVSSCAMLPITDSAQSDKDYLTTQEHAELQGRPLQSKAGMIALKNAILQVCSNCGYHGYTGLSFVIKHDVTGAPYILEKPAGLPPIQVSISHTRRYAYGLASMETGS